MSFCHAVICLQVARVDSVFSFNGGSSFLEGGNIRTRASGDPLGALGDLGRWWIGREVCASNTCMWMWSVNWLLSLSHHILSFFLSLFLNLFHCLSVFSLCLFLSLSHRVVFCPSRADCLCARSWVPGPPPAPGELAGSAFALHSYLRQLDNRCK